MSSDDQSLRIGYDKFWGLVLLLTCLAPLSVPGGDEPPVFLWNALAAGGEEAGPFQAWLMLGTLAGFVGLVGGLVLSAGGRARHVVVLVVAGGTVLLPLLNDKVAVPLGSEGLEFAAPLLYVGRLQGLAMAAILIAYLGSGMRIVRRGQISGLLVGGLGSILLVLSLVVPVGGAQQPAAFEIADQIREFESHRATILSVGLLAAAGLLGCLNLIHTRFEVLIAQWVRLLLVAGYLVPVIETFVGQRPDLDSLQSLLPQAWGSVRILACMMMTVDSLTALFTMLVTRGND